MLGAVVAAAALHGFAGAIAGTYFPTEPAPVEVTPANALIGFAIGVVAAFVAAWFPASRAAAEAPSDAVRRGPEVETGRPAAGRGRLALAGAATVATLVLVAAPAVGGRWNGYLAAVTLLVTFVATAPALLALGARASAPLLGRAGIPGRLAAGELLAHPRRSALPSAALALGLAMVVENAGVIRSMSEETVAWMETEVAGDLFVSSGQTVMRAAGHTPLEAALRQTIADVPGVARVTGVRFLHAPWRDTRVLVLALDMEQYVHMARVTVKGPRPRDALLAEVVTGRACLVSDNFVLLHGVGIGDDLELPAARGPVRLRVVGTFVDYAWPRGTVMLERSLLEREWDDRVVDEFSVKLVLDADAAAVTRRIVAALGPDREPVVTSARELQAAARALLDDFFQLASAQVAAALAVAFLGIVNALWISVVLRRRELGLLRAVGATRGQVTAAIVLQAGAMGVIGAVLGLVGGALLLALALGRIIPGDTGWVYPLRFPWDVAAASALLGVVTSAAAGFLPARRAASHPLREALSAE